MEDILIHYGTPRHSGRYPYGSGDNPYQHEKDFLASVRELRNNGLTESEIAKGMGLSTTQLRAKISIASENQLHENILHASRLKAKGMSATEIGRQMGVNESTVRGWLEKSNQERISKTRETANFIKANVDEKKLIDIGIGVERELGITRTKLDTAVEMLKEEGYQIMPIRVPQVHNPGQYTTVKVLAAPGTEYKDIYEDVSKIQSINGYSDDMGKTFKTIEYPTSIDSNRLAIRYAEEGGKDKDGVIEIRKGLNDISLGESNYAQVRIAVDGTHYLKGMAIYSDDLPKGVDILFNTNKTTDVPMEKVLKPLKDNPDLPFGSTIKRQLYYKDEKGNEKLSPVNIVNEEGDWDEWSRTLSSQFLAKQSQKLIDKQLDLSATIKQEEFNDIMKLENPAVRKRYLDSFADDCDAASIHLKAAALPRQRAQVILPLTDISENEVYAPNFRNGEKVVLIRYPHAGTFEIPEVTVNNNNAQGKSLLGNAIDAIGINVKVAQKLSGADFDGDSVMVIPNNGPNKITTSTLKQLEGFDPSEKYPLPDSAPKMTSQQKGMEMGKVSNLITDMTIQGATPDELVRAVKHSMVVIDAEKHHLDYKQSEIDNDIAGLKKKYQKKYDEDGNETGKYGGASTLISRAKATKYVPERQLVDKNGNKTWTADPETGEYLYGPTGRTYINKKGKVVVAKEKVTNMELTKDAHTLSTGTKQEESYANYANKMKALANQARKESLAIKTEKADPQAKLIFKEEVASLNAKLNTALKNAPKERQAELIAKAQVDAKKKANPDIDSKELKKEAQQALATARVRVGANKKDVMIDISDKEWEAIQNHAISTSKLNQILQNTNLDDIKKRATPREQVIVTSAKQNRINQMNAMGYTNAEIADYLGISVSTVTKYIK